MSEGGGIYERCGDGSGVNARENRGVSGTRVRHLVSRKRVKQPLTTPEYLESLPMFDETEEMKYLRQVNLLVRIQDPAKKRTTYIGGSGTALPEWPAGEDTGGCERRLLVEGTPGDTVCNITGWQDMHPLHPE
jgi:hypothetical protein